MKETGADVLKWMNSQDTEALEAWCRAVLEKGAIAQDDMLRVQKEPYSHLDQLKDLLPGHLQARYQSILADQAHTVLQNDGQAILIGLGEFRASLVHGRLFAPAATTKMPFLVASPNGETMAFAQLAPGRVFMYDSHRKHVATVDEAEVMRTILGVYGVKKESMATEEDLSHTCATSDMEMSFFIGEI